MVSMIKLSLLIACFFSTSVILSQAVEESVAKSADGSVTSTVEESIRNMSLGDQNAVTLRLPNQDSKSAEKLLKQYLENHHGSRTKKVRRSHESLTEDALLPSISSNPVDVYHEVIEMGEGSVVYLWVDMGGSFLSSDASPEAYEGMADVLADYKRDIKVANIGLELEAEQAKIKDLEKEQDKIVKEMTKQMKEIEDCKLLITNNEVSIPNEEKDIEVMSERVKEQEKRAKDAHSDTAKKLEKKSLKSIERDLKKLENTLEKHRKEIDDCRSKITENEGLIQNGESNIEALLKNIEEHKEMAKQINAKLEKAKA